MAMSESDLATLTQRVKRYVDNLEKYRLGFAKAESERKTLFMEREESTWREAFRIAADDGLRLRLENEELRKKIRELERR